MNHENEIKKPHENLFDIISGLIQTKVNNWFHAMYVDNKVTMGITNVLIFF